MSNNDSHKLAELIKDVRVAMFTTFPGGMAGAASARPMWTQKLDSDSFDGTLWFMTNSGSAMVRDLSVNPVVLLTYALPDKNRYIAVYASAKAEKNPEMARELWNIHAKGWYPGGPDDPTLTLLRVTVERAEYWDGPSNTSYMLSLLKAVATHERVHTSGEHDKVQM